MKNQNETKQSDEVSTPYEGARKKQPPKAFKDKVLISALLLLVITGGVFVYMWHEMRSQLTDQRNDTVLLAQEIEQLKEEAESNKTDATSIRVIAEEYQKMLTAARENPVQEPVEEDKVLAAAAAKQNASKPPKEANVLAVYNRDKPKHKGLTALVYWPGSNGKKGLFLEAVKNLDGTWQANNPLKR